MVSPAICVLLHQCVVHPGAGWESTRIVIVRVVFSRCFSKSHFWKRRSFLQVEEHEEKLHSEDGLVLCTQSWKGNTDSALGIDTGQNKRKSQLMPPGWAKVTS